MALKSNEGSKYADQWKTWWRTLNPDWRQEVGGRLSRSETQGDWACMLHVGSNGFVNILAGLIAYHGVSTDGEWKEAAEDVAWVLEQLVVAASSLG